MSQLVIGLHQEDIISMLGNPDPPDTPYKRPLVWIYSFGYPWSWAGAIIIFFDEDGIAINTVIANPIHELGG